MRAIALLVLVACTDPVASIEITGARVFRLPDLRVGVDVDVRAHEASGGNIGLYCTQVTFAGQTSPVESCNADLEDGDSRTVRTLSDGDLGDGAAISVRVRHQAVDIGRSLVAPGH